MKPAISVNSQQASVLGNLNEEAYFTYIPTHANTGRGDVATVAVLAQIFTKQ
jgi:hypothetical protein